MRWVVLLAAALALGCASPSTPQPATPAPKSKTPGYKALERARIEQELGDRIDTRLARDFGFSGDKPAIDYVQRVGRCVARHASRGEPSYRFRIVDDASVNAFAAPGGYVYVTRGMLEHLGSEAELAGVLAHEIAHIDKRHALTERAWEEDRSLIWTSADTLAFYERSRDNERAADAVAVRALHDAGYDPSAMVRLFERLEALEPNDEVASPGDEHWLATHPTTRARVARTGVAAGAYARSPPGRLGRRAHLAAVNGLVYGDNPLRGALAGGSYLLPQARLAFDLPEGFQAEAGPGVMSATSPDKKTTLILLVTGRVEADIEGISLDDAQRGRLAQQPVAWGKVDVGRGVEARFVVIELPSELVLLVGVSKSPDGSTLLDGLVKRFRGYSPAALAPAWKRIRVVTLHEPSTLAAVARDAPVALDELEALNGVESTKRLPAGTRLKLVREYRR